jgi:UDP-glucose 4-epimerase
MNIFITGGAGFIGSNLVERFIAEGHKVKVLDNLSTGRIENLNAVMGHANFEFFKHTVTDKAFMEPHIKWADEVYHLAAPVGVKYIMDNPVLTILDNVRGIDAILELVNKYKKKVLVASTSEVYGRSLDFLDPTGVRKLKEDDYRVEGSTMNHRWAYANTKAMDEFLSLAYYKEFQTRVVVVRFFNTVGPRQLSLYGMVIPNFVQAALANTDIPVFGDGNQKRSFMHVNDVMRAVTGLMASPTALGHVFNVGNPVELTMNELAEKVIRICGSSSKIQHIPYEQAYGKGYEDMNRRTADIGKLTEHLGFKVEYDIDGILTDIIQYHKAAMQPA